MMRDKTLEAAFSAAYQEEVRDNIARDGRLGTASLVMNALATVVACEGLFSNSPAVVIGAMIIAVLLGPIIAIALSLVVGNNTLLRQALLSEAAGVLVVLSVAFALGVIHRDLPLTVEFLSREPKSSRSGDRAGGRSGGRIRDDLAAVERGPGRGGDRHGAGSAARRRRHLRGAR